jgi:hypothetical protein
LIVMVLWHLRCGHCMQQSLAIRSHGVHALPPFAKNARDGAPGTCGGAPSRSSRKSRDDTGHSGSCLFYDLSHLFNRGWMSEKYPLPAGQKKCFHLTSPFIEPARRRITLRYEVFCNILILRLLKLYARFEKYRRGGRGKAGTRD